MPKLSAASPARAEAALQARMLGLASGFDQRLKEETMTRRSELLERARRMRADPTDAERRLWAYLRGRRMAGCRFLRQRPIGRYIVDFYCPEARLVVEADGDHHAGCDHDRRRDALLRQLGLKVLRFSDHDILTRLDSVLQSVLDEVERRRPAPS